MAARELARSPATEKATALSAAFARAPAQEILRAAIKDLFAEQIALVSSFGAESAVLLHMAAAIDPATPVLFIDTGMLFAETLAYRGELISRLGLTNAVTVEPDPVQLAKEDGENFLWSGNPDRCCQLRKVLPLARALEGYGAWISGRKRFQAHTRKSLPLFEADGARIKINPLAHWSAPEIAAYLQAHRLPAHPLAAKGYLSIGCIPCTSPVKPGEDARAGRWRGRGKIECGLHTQPLDSVLGS
jgi:phosphoadenosine phosphosulfate reductase